MSDKDWDKTMAAFVHGAYKCMKAAWPYFRKQTYGRIINTSSNIFDTSGGVNNSGMCCHCSMIDVTVFFLIQPDAKQLPRWP